MKKFSNVKIAGVSAPLYKALVIILAVVIAMGKLPLNMVGITFMLVVLGHLFYFLGEAKIAAKSKVKTDPPPR